MPSITFVLPHWLYWLGLAVFPLIAMYAVARQKRNGPEPGASLAIAYMFWLTAGFTGLHRIYVRSKWAIVYILLFVAVIYCNVQVKDARETMSAARQALKTASFDLDQAQTALKREVAGAAQRLEKARQAEGELKLRMAAANATHDNWDRLSAAFGSVILLFLIVDAVLLPRLVRQCKEREAREPPRKFAPTPLPPTVHEQGTGEDPTLKVRSPAARLLDRVTGACGVFVAYWTLLSIFVYYYEVVVRFVFNSPTNWVHESMFLMFGMQYLLAGAYAMQVDAHVRVDVFYVKWSDRGKALADVLTSFFFFVFVGTMLVTGWIYMADATRLGEVSFTEWGIQYWPVKIAIPLGALLLLLQGLSKLIKDIQILTMRGT